MISRRHLLLLGGAAALPWPGRADENGSGRGPRHALIIGNAGYSEGIGTLANPVRDAHRVAEGVVECGFSLVTGDVVKDAGRSEMMSAFRAYVDAMQASGPDATGFVYYSGHGADRPVDRCLPKRAETAGSGTRAWRRGILPWPAPVCWQRGRAQHVHLLRHLGGRDGQRRAGR